MSEVEVSATARVELREITKANLRDVMLLSVREDQKHLVAANAWSIAQAAYEDVAWLRAVYADDTPVGFVLVAENDAGPADFLWRFMVDVRYQGLGFGRRAMERVVARTRTRTPKREELRLSHAVADGHAGPFYQRLGFEYTGEKLGTELLMRLVL